VTTADSLRLRSFAKVNLALSILGKRPDGYHELRTVLQTVDLCDEIELTPAPELTLEVEGDPVLAALPAERNLVLRAARALAASAPAPSGAAIRLRKRIPTGAGLGGGSSNAAAVLLGLNRLWRVGLEPADLAQLAASLGSDVPFFLRGGTALGIGRGEEVYPLPDLAPTPLVILFPGVAVPTADAYASLDSTLTSRRDPRKMLGFCGQLAGGAACLTRIFNDFETSILPAHPAVREAKQFLERQGATTAMLSGSGSSVFGFFVDEESALAAARAVTREAWRAFPAKTLDRAEYLRQLFA
jgi:4-diphosphocytidyl-2-C-methyl-D-erythritol kinase